MKPVIVGVMSFAVSTAAAAGIAVVTAKKVPVPVASSTPSTPTAAPPASKDSVPLPGDSAATHKSVARPESAAVKAPAPPPPPAPASALGPAPAPPPPPRPSAVAVKAAPPVDIDQPAGIKRIGQMLANMKPAEAAKLLGFLTDSQVADVIGQLNPRVAGPVLAALPQERAGAVSRLILHAKGSP